MASKKSKRTQAALANKKARGELARLKELGLYRGNARKNPTRYAKEQIIKYRDVLEKRAKVITVPKRGAAREYTEVYRTKFARLSFRLGPVKNCIIIKPRARFFHTTKSMGMHPPDISQACINGERGRRDFARQATSLCDTDWHGRGRCGVRIRFDGLR